MTSKVGCSQNSLCQNKPPNTFTLNENIPGWQSRVTNRWPFFRICCCVTSRHLANNHSIQFPAAFNGKQFLRYGFEKVAGHGAKFCNNALPYKCATSVRTGTEGNDAGYLCQCHAKLIGPYPSDCMRSLSARSSSFNYYHTCIYIFHLLCRHECKTTYTCCL